MIYILIFSNDDEDGDHTLFSNDLYFDNEDEAAVYQKKLVDLPKWYYYLVASILFILGVFGILLNGFVIWCFATCPTVSNKFHELCSKKHFTKIDHIKYNSKRLYMDR